MIFEKYQSIHSLNKHITSLVNSGDIDAALRLIYKVVERVFTEPLCTSQVFSSQTLDDLCQHIGKLNLATINHTTAKLENHTQNVRSVFVYIVTKLQKSGGHTRVIEDFIKARPEAQHIILSTELAGKSEADYLLQGLGKQVEILFEQAPKQNYQQRLTWLQTRLLTLQPERVYLFNHHQDSVAVAAIQPEMQLNASFYHHGDHHLCLGVHLPHFEHIDPHPMGYHYCRDVLGVENTYIPLSVEDKGKRSNEQSFMQNGTLTTCTAARSNKIEIPYFVSYLELLPKLLQTTGGTHIHIGRLSPWALFKIRHGLKRANISESRFIYKPWVLSVWKALQEEQVDLYIASFPYGGGLTLIEAMGAGIPVVLHRHLFSRVLSGIDLAHPATFSWRYPEELLNYCTSVTPTALREVADLNRERYEQFHSQQQFLTILNQEIDKRPKPEKLSTQFSVASDEWAIWAEQQITVTHIISRAVYRWLRQIRAGW